MRVWSYTRQREVESRDATFEDFKLAVVSDTLDDWLGVYEVWWQANGWYPDLPVSERLAIAERAVSELLSQRLVTLYISRTPGLEKTAVTPSQEHDVLRAWDTWAVPDGPRAFLEPAPDAKAAVGSKPG